MGGKWLAAAGLGLLTLLSATSAQAQRNIGAAVTVERDVSGVLSGRTRSVSSNDRVFANENIRTANASAAQLQFLDETRLSIGPEASVLLDDFVFDPDRTAKKAVVRASVGAMRWVSGASAPRAYGVRTPHAVIGVRGTAFDLLVERARTTVTLREGEISVCLIRAPRRCVIMSAPGEVVVVTNTTISGPRAGGVSPTQFASRCLQPIDRSACVGLTTAEVVPIEPPPIPPWHGFYAGAHGGYDASRTAVRTGGYGPTDSVATSIRVGNVPAGLRTEGSSWLAGIHGGYTWQFGTGVFGVEADLSKLTAEGEDVVVRNPFGVRVTTRATHEVDYLATFRARAGMAFDNVLLFATGGLALGDVELRGSIVPLPAANPTYFGSDSQIQPGFAVGGGIEFALSRQVSVRAEYLHYDLGSRTLVLRETTGGAPGEFATMRFKTRGDIVRAGLSARF